MGHGTNECLLSREAAPLPRRPCGRGHAATIPPAVLPLPISSFDVPPFLPSFPHFPSFSPVVSHMSALGAVNISPAVRGRPSASVLRRAWWWRRRWYRLSWPVGQENGSPTLSLPRFANFVEKSPRKQRVSGFLCRPWSAISLAIPNRNERRTKAQASLCLWRERREER